MFYFQVDIKDHSKHSLVPRVRYLLLGSRPSIQEIQDDSLQGRNFYYVDKQGRIKMPVLFVRGVPDFNDGWHERLAPSVKANIPAGMRYFDYFKAIPKLIQDTSLYEYGIPFRTGSTRMSRFWVGRSGILERRDLNGFFVDIVLSQGSRIFWRIRGGTDKLDFSASESVYASFLVFLPNWFEIN